MKKKNSILIAMLVLTIMSCKKHEVDEVEASPDQIEKGWNKIPFPFDEDLVKALHHKDEFLIFSHSNCYASTDLKKWELRPIPEKVREKVYFEEPTAAEFKGQLYIASKNGLCRSSDGGRNWEHLLNVHAEAVSANDEYLYVVSGGYSYKTKDGFYFEHMESLFQKLRPGLRKPHANISFFKANNKRILLSGDHGGSRFEIESFDKGLSWQKSSEYFIRGLCGDQKIMLNHFGFEFLATGPLNFKIRGGNLRAVTKVSDDYLFGGETNEYFHLEDCQNMGIIFKNDDISSAIYFPEKIIFLGVIEGKLMATGGKGSIYIYY